MTKLLPILIGALFWAWMTEASTRGKFGVHRQSVSNWLAFCMLVVTLALPIVLRRTYNDTGAYINGFLKADPIGVLLVRGELHLLRNPMFRIYESLVRTFTDNYTLFFLFPAVFVQYSYMRFIRRHSPSLLVGVALYLFLGTYTFSIAAMKQVWAMAILLYAVDALIERKLLRFSMLVFLAALFHTYAIMFLVLLVFGVKPWSPRSFLVLLGIILVMYNFEPVLTAFLEVANESGKHVSAEEILGTAAINPIRVAVYAVPPLFALVFHPWLFLGREDREHNILVNMSFLTVAIMSVGLVSAANMFARMGQYFEFGVICGLPWMLKQPFEKSSVRLVYLLAMVCFAGYFCYAHLVQIYFDDHFGRYTVMEFVDTLWRGFLFG